MSKSILILVSFLLIFASARSEPIGDVRIMTTVRSLDKKWATVEIAGLTYRVPRDALRGEPLSGKKHEVTLTQEQYKELMAKDSEKTPKQ